LVNSTNVLVYSKNAIDRIYYALKLRKKTIIKEEKDLVTPFNFDFLEIKNLSFSYKKNKILEDINLQINPRDFIFLTGPSGSGKTTFLDILCGLIPTDSGSIIVNNDNSENALNTFRNKIYYLSQNNFVLDDTLERNIAFANKEIDKNKLDLAIKLSGLENFILKLKDQNNRNLGENASKISGGELQRIALARAIYADKDILILDEFTSSLDKKNEIKIFETILKLNKTKTILVVSHNTEISKIAKKSFKIENRKIINFS
jgi:ATP-binding cassette subfamily B protein